MLTTNEFSQFILQVKKEENLSPINEEAIIQVAQLVSGSFTFPLYEALWRGGFDMKAITTHLECMYDNAQQLGFVYFIFILADGVGLNLPIKFIQMCSDSRLIPALSAAIIDDWLEL